ncbi:hypothetical protein QBC44DRAFT_311887 [Cladorrhinum sp. PSN332]|nr:hypothetical protein QBC44DRAFT_311887 [Cladorrhinum sp. PSN332]
MTSVVGYLSQLVVLKALNVTLIIAVTAAVLSPKPSETLSRALWLIGLFILATLLFGKSCQHFRNTAKTEAAPAEVKDIYESQDLSYEAVHGYRSCGCPRRRCLHGVWHDAVPPSPSPELSPEPTEEASQDSSQSRNQNQRSSSSSDSPDSDLSRGNGRKSRFGFRRDVTPPDSPTITNQTSSRSNTISSISTGRPSETEEQAVQPQEIFSPTISSVSTGSARPDDVSQSPSGPSHRTQSSSTQNLRATRSSTGRYPAIMLDGATDSELSERERYTIFNPRVDRVRGSRTGYDDFLSDYDGYWDVMSQRSREGERNGALLSPAWAPEDGGLRAMLNKQRQR